MQGAVQATVAAQVGPCVPRQPLGAESDFLMRFQLVDIAEQTSPAFFDFAYENALDDDAFHLCLPI